MRRSIFLQEENWHGSYYELAMEYHPGGNDQRLLTALHALWETPSLSGPWRSREDFQSTIALPQRAGAYPHRLYGVLTLPGARSVGCVTVTVREENGSDWLDLCIPMGMLELVFPVVYPIARKNSPWLEEVDEALLKVAEAVYQASPFNVALIGEEVSGYVNEQEITPAVLARGGVIVPVPLSGKLKAGVPAIARAGGLHWFPWRDSSITYE